MTTTKARFQVEVSDEQDRLLDKLIDETGLSGKRDLFNNALSLFYWAVERSKEGRIIASLSPDGKSLRELEMPALMNLRDKAKSEKVAGKAA